MCFLAYATPIILCTALLKDSGPSESRLVQVHTLCIWDMSVFFKINVCLQNQLYLFALICVHIPGRKKKKKKSMKYYSLRFPAFDTLSRFPPTMSVPL